MATENWFDRQRASLQLLQTLVRERAAGEKDLTDGYAASVDAACKELSGAGLTAKLMIDCSHANSQKRHERQIDVAGDIGMQVAGGDERIFGVMLESHLNPGRQDLVPDQPLQYGVSITDACIGWEATIDVLKALAEAVRLRRGKVGKDA